MSFYPNLSQFYPNFIQINHELKWLAIFVHELSQLPSSMHSVTQSLKCCSCLFIQIYLSFIQISSQFYPNFIQIVHQLKLFAICLHELSLLPSSMHSVKQSLKCCQCLFIQIYLSFIQISSQFYPNFIQIVHQLKLLAIFVHELSLLPSSMRSVTQSLKCCLCLFIQALYEVLKHLDKVVFELYLNFIQIFNKKTHLIQI